MSADEQGQAVAAKRRGRIRTRWLVVGIVVVVLAAYLGVISLYAASGRPLTSGDPVGVQSEDVVVALTAKAVSGTAEHITMDVKISPPESMLDPRDGITMTQDLSVLITPVDGEQAITLKSGSIPSTSTINILAAGSIENWPFDRYEAGYPGDAVASGVVILAYKTVDGAKIDLPTRVVMNGNVPGWNFDVGTVVRPDLGSVGSQNAEEPITAVTLTAYRSGSTLAFGFLLLGLLVVMPTLVLIVAILAFTGKRKVEATLMSWMGAMLFATIPLRTFLPGSPPIGSWIDFLIVLWVIVALVAGLGIYVAAWVRWNGPATKPPRPPASES
ncbi:DUF4436 family protein [Herbiconiux sp. 11R-BC]|uniref:DUF4436 family protein n=1 Tax=Herbiconiux sp. 11R-BC TaxID=3111637 RepID=UPI003C03788F